jgi:hypothetical protein
MADTMRGLAQAVADGKLTAEDAAGQIAALGSFVSREEYESAGARAERFNDDLPVAGENSFVTVTALWMARKLTDDQYNTIKAAFNLKFVEDQD